MQQAVYTDRCLYNSWLLIRNMKLHIHFLTSYLSDIVTMFCRLYCANSVCVFKTYKELPAGCDELWPTF